MANLQIVCTPAPIAALQVLAQSANVLVEAQAAAAALLNITTSPADAQIDVLAATYATLNIYNAQSQLALDVTPLMRGPQGAKGDTGSTGNTGATGGNYLTVCLNSAQIAAKGITLPSIPQSEVQLQVIGGTAQKQNIDFVVSAQALGWSGLALELLLSEGDYLSISYS